LSQRRFRIAVRFAQIQVLANRDTFKPCRLLPCEGQAQPGPFMHLEGEKVCAIEQNGSCTRRIALAAHEDIGESRFARAVGSEERMDLTRLDRQIKPVENRMAIHLEGEIVNVEQGVRHCHIAIHFAIVHWACLLSHNECWGACS